MLEHRVGVAIPPYRSGQFRGRRSPSGRSGMQIKSQSHHTDQGSSEYSCRSFMHNLGNRSLVAIPPYRSGQFRVGRLPHLRPQDKRRVAIPPYRSGQFRGARKPGEQGGSPKSRNPTIQIRAVPSQAGKPKLFAKPQKSQSHHTDQGSSEYVTFEAIAHGIVLESQSHHTDQGSSETTTMAKAPLREASKSQSHHTDQGSSEASEGAWRAGLQNLEVAIPPYRSGQFRGKKDMMKKMGPKKKSQSHHTDQGSSEEVRQPRNRRSSGSSRNPTIQIRAVPRAAVPTL